jgi:DtxR family manganese transport transcriptional regulator
MPTSRKPGNRHVRTRHDHATELAEDYVEAIDEIEREKGECRVTDLARQFSVTHVTVNRTVSRLQRDGLAETQPYAPVTLTRAGRRLAEASRKRHEVVLQFLLDLGVSEDAARTDAEGIEHHVSDETLRVMKQFSENR